MLLLADSWIWLADGLDPFILQLILTDQDWTAYRCFLRLDQNLPVSQGSVLAGAPVEAGVGGVGGAGQVDRLTGLAATSSRQWGRQRHQRRVSGAESHRRLAEGHVAAAAASLTAVGGWTVVNTHLRDGRAQHGLQLQGDKTEHI